jgi:hypothetical protein
MWRLSCSRYRRLKTLSPTQARTNWRSLLKRAANGEDIGIVYGDHVITFLGDIEAKIGR